MTELPSETARQKALDRFDRSERGRYKFVIALSAVEMIFWGLRDWRIFPIACTYSSSSRFVPLMG